jgi:cysteine-rich repeat protein
VRSVVIFAALVSANCGRVRFDPSDLGDANRIADADPNCMPLDEDCDSIPNATDNCPTVANVDQSNVGESMVAGIPDSVGDACDPRPSAGGDFIARFEGFDGQPGALGLFGAATVTDGRLLLGATTAQTVGSASFPRVNRLTRAAFAFEVLATTPGPGEMWSGYWYQESDLFPNATFANVSARVGVRNIEAEIKEVTEALGSRYSNTLSYGANFASGDTYEFEIDTALKTGGAHNMKISTAGTVMNASITLAEPNKDEGRPYLESNRMTAAYRYLILYSNSVCGNGIVEGTERCDDGNAVNGDGCSATCSLET